jgi:hypothetical protein
MVISTMLLYTCICTCELSEGLVSSCNDAVADFCPTECPFSVPGDCSLGSIRNELMYSMFIFCGVQVTMGELHLKDDELV